MLRKRIKWEKWISPFEVNEDEDDDDEYGENWKNKGKNNIALGQTIVGPIGIIPVTEHGNPGSLYNFWMMHTNFNISEPICNLINKIDGVEGLDVFTRYRARLAFAKLFDDEDVREQIDKLLCEQEIKPAPQQAPLQQKSHLDAIKHEMQAKYKHWFIAITEKDEIKLFGNDDREIVEKKLLEYPNAQICKSW